MLRRARRRRCPSAPCRRHPSRSRSRARASRAGSTTSTRATRASSAAACARLAAASARRKSPCAVRQRSRVRVSRCAGLACATAVASRASRSLRVSMRRSRARRKPRLELVEPLRALAQLHARVTALQPVREHREVPPLRRDAAPRARGRAAARSRAKRLSHSRWSGTASSAACDGVGARRSATKSAIVKSISWPTPTMIGQLRRRRSRARRLLR